MIIGVSRLNGSWGGPCLPLYLSSVPAVLVELGPLDLVGLGPLEGGRVAGLRPCLGLVPGPRAPAGPVGTRWPPSLSYVPVRPFRERGASTSSPSGWSGPWAHCWWPSGCAVIRCSGAGLCHGPRSGVSFRLSTVTPWTGRPAPASPAGTTPPGPGPGPGRVIAVDGKGTEGIGPPDRHPPASALRGHPPPGRGPRPDGGGSEDERDHALAAPARATGPSRSSCHL